MLLFISRLPVIYWQSVCRLNGIVLQYECCFQWRGRTWALEGSELDRSGECTICKHPFPFLFTCQDSRSRLFSARPCAEPEGKQLGSQLQFLNLAFPQPPHPGNDLHVLGLVLEAVLKLTWFSPLTACWVNSKPTCSSSCSGISHIWWTFSVLRA